MSFSAGLGMTAKQRQGDQVGGYGGGSTGVGRGPRPGRVRQRRRIWSQCVFQDLRWFQKGSTEWRKDDSQFGLKVSQKEGKDSVAESETRRGPTGAAHSLPGASGPWIQKGCSQS